MRKADKIIMLSIFSIVLVGNANRLNASSLGSEVTNPAFSAKHILVSGQGFFNGLYWIDNDGYGGQSAVQLYSDMTTFGGGWTQVLNKDGVITSGVNLNTTNFLSANNYTYNSVNYGIDLPSTQFLVKVFGAGAASGKQFSGMFTGNIGELNDYLTISKSFDFSDWNILQNSYGTNILNSIASSNVSDFEIFIRESVAVIPYLEPTQPVPEPSTFILLGAGIGGLALYRRRQAKKQV